MALLSGLVGALGRFSVPFYGWLLAGLGPVRLQGFCGALVPGFLRVDGLQVALMGAWGVRGRSSALVGGERSSPLNMAFDYKDVYKVFILHV